MQTAPRQPVLPRRWSARRLPLVLAAAACIASLGAAPELKVTLPPDAVVLFDGKDLSGWQHGRSGAPARWQLVDGAMEVVPGTGSIRSKALFRDFQLHVEFNVPHMPQARGQARGNSGVYLQGLYEIQVLDSYGLKPETGDCGAIYGQASPMVNACRPPEEWQSYDILFHAARFDPAGALVERARVSVLQNGIWIHDNVAIGDRSTDSLGPEPHKAGPILLQDHGNRVRFRNIWLRPLTEGAGTPATARAVTRSAPLPRAASAAPRPIEPALAGFLPCRQGVSAPDVSLPGASPCPRPQNKSLSSSSRATWSSRT